MTTGLSFYGDWSRVSNVLGGISVPRNLDSFERALANLGNAIKKKIELRVNRGDIGWPALSPRTVIRKGHTKIYVETGKFLNSIKVVVRKKSKGIIEVSIKPTGTNDEGVSYEDIHRWLEFGTSRMPARPLWRPIMKQVPTMPEFKEVKRVLQKELKGSL